MLGKTTLQQRWFLLASSLGIGTAVVGTALYLTTEYQHRESDVQNVASVLARTLPQNGVHSAEHYDQHMAAASIDPLIKSVCAFGADGTLLGSYHDPLAPGPDCAVPGDQHPGYLLRSSRMSSERESHQVSVYASKQSLLKMVLDRNLPIILAMLLVLLVVVGLALALARSALRPIKELTASALTFDPDAPSLQTTINSPQEVNELGSAFNRVIDSLLSTQQSLTEEISNRKSIEVAERRSRELLRDIVDLVPYLIFAQRWNGELIFANEAVAELYDTDLEALLDGSFQAAYQGPQPDGLIFCQSSRTTRGEESWFTDREGDVHRFLITRVPYLKDASRLVIGVDVTEEHRLQMQLQFSQRLEVIGTLAGGIAHDFNNLLTPILGYTSMLRETALPDDVQTKLQAVETAAQRARDVVQQILTFSRQNQGVPNPDPINVTEVVSEAVKLMRASIPASISIDEHVEPVGKVLVDQNQLHQVIVNLCTNAAQAMPHGEGKIDISVRSLRANSEMIPSHMPAMPYACIEVADTGSGMPLSIVSHIFEPFFTTKEVGQGSGLGLSVVHGIVTNYDGEILVESEEGRGSVFRVLLPLEAQESVDSPQPPEREGHVLLVEDEHAVLSVTAELLARQGFTVEPFDSPLLALETFRSKPAAYDVLVTDHNMPGMTGAELARAIRAVRPDMPIILITGFTSASVDDLEGIDHKIMKPVSGRELSMVIQQCLASRNHAA